LISHRTGAWYAMIYGTATYYRHLRFEPESNADQAAAVSARRPGEAWYLTGLDAALAGSSAGAETGAGRAGRGRGRGGNGAEA
jgi:predicted N-acetyltransferase YhbS